MSDSTWSDMLAVSFRGLSLEILKVVPLIFFNLYYYCRVADIVFQFYVNTHTYYLFFKTLFIIISIKFLCLLEFCWAFCYFLTLFDLLDLIFSFQHNNNISIIKKKVLPKLSAINISCHVLY